MSREWLRSLKPGMLVRIISSVQKELIGKLAVVKEVTVNSPRAIKRFAKDDDEFLEIEVLVVFPDIVDNKTRMVQRGNQFGKSTVFPDFDNSHYEKVFRPEHIAPASTMDRLIYG